MFLSFCGRASQCSAPRLLHSLSGSYGSGTCEARGRLKGNFPRLFSPSEHAGPQCSRVCPGHWKLSGAIFISISLSLLYLFNLDGLSQISRNIVGSNLSAPVPLDKSLVCWVCVV